MLEQLFAFMAHAHRSSEADFLAKYPEPVFIVDPFQHDDGTHFRTTSGAGGMGTQTSVARIRKRPGANSFDMMVTLGRATNNDIEIRSPDISKFHAYVMFGPDGQALLTDSGSTYGTYVGQRRLQPREEKYPLSAGEVVRLGSVSMTYQPATGFFRYLQNPD